MAIVIHETHPGKFYAYDHHRVGNKIVSTYLGKADRIGTQQSIIAAGYPITDKSYTTQHKKTDKQEEKEYGNKRFDELEDAIKQMPPGELAGTHTKDGKLIVSDKLPKKLQGQVLRHEFIEHRHMEGHGAKGRPGSEREKRIREALRHPDVLGAGSDKRRRMRLSKSEHIEAVMREYQRGTLHSSSGDKVTTRDQALAIAHSEYRSG